MDTVSVCLLLIVKSRDVLVHWILHGSEITKILNFEPKVD